ncbi:MAG: 3-hydroxyacyl-ACP dehydratase FabZ [Cyanobacteria bacterium NC_groundwater_1444_Ag_S-0.65um_54_12]|nr:3-hydroxyacyl-ACP dehydratase FabZ [Cyanobacteria bacterium NC_groundwater_1444_Ag_S-0.65um_54_12]
MLKILPHRFPFLLVDRILELDPGKRAVALKNVSVNEPQFTGHFPERPLMPGVLMVEAMAQVGGLILLTDPKHDGKLAVFAGIDGVRFRHMVFPGDQLIMTAELVKFRSGIGRVQVSARVEDKLVTDGDLLFSLV